MECQVERIGRRTVETMMDAEASLFQASAESIRVSPVNSQTGMPSAPKRSLQSLLFSEQMACSGQREGGRKRKEGGGRRKKKSKTRVRRTKKKERETLVGAR